MTREEGKSKRKETLLKKLGSEAAVSEYYRTMGKKSLSHPNRRKGAQHRGYFNMMPKEELRALSREAAYKKHENQKEHDDSLRDAL